MLSLLVVLCAACAAPTEKCIDLPEEVDFGETPTGMVRNQAVEFANPRGSARVVMVEALRAPFGPEAEQSFTILAGGRQIVNLTFLPDDGRLHLDEVLVRGGDDCEPQPLKLRGIGSGRVVLLERPTFPAIPVGTQVRGDVVLFNGKRTTEQAQLSIFIPSGTPAFFTAPVDTELPPNSVVRIPVTFTAARDGPVSVLGLVSTRDFMESLQFDGMGGIPHVELSHTVVSAGLVPLSTTHQRHVYLRNSGDGALFVRSVEITPGPGTQRDELKIDVQQSGLAHASEAAITISFQPFVQGPHTWTVTIVTNDPAAPRVSFSVSANFDLVQSCEQAADPTVSQLEVNGPYPQSALIAIANPGATPCLLEGLEFDAFTDWTLELPTAEDSLFVNAGATLSLPVRVTGPGTRFVRWSTWQRRSSQVLLIAH